MKTYFLMLPLAAALALPAIAQQNLEAQSDTKWSSSNPKAAPTSQPTTSQDSAAQSSPTQNSAAQSSSATTSDQSPSSDQNLSARQPLEPDYHQGFWGKMNPFARKKYVQKQLAPIRNRTNELDDLTAANARQIKDVDARAQEGIRQADAKATQADQHALEAGNRAQQANQTALQASNRLNTVEQVVGNIDQYQPAIETEIRLRPGQTTLSPKAKQAIDDMTANLKDQQGYIIEVQGFSTAGGQAGIQSSRAMANSVVRYLVEKNEIPVYRIFVIGMGNAKIPASDGSAMSAHGNRVEVSLLKNNVSQLAQVKQNPASTQPPQSQQ
ncbi:MAG: OmpA family protein [Acidobacteriota bacterium]|nr:OmpA family protein [Acidobacteriota bacterium]